MIKTSSSKSWRFKYRVDGKEKLLVIGDYPAHSLAQARKARDSAKALLAQGIDSNGAKQDEKRIKEAARGETFVKLGHAFLAKQRKEGKSKATLDKTEYHLKLANQDFGNKPITEITAPMILKTLRKLEAKGNDCPSSLFLGFWNQSRPKLRESLAHLIGLIMRRAGGDASVALRVSSV